MGGYLGKDDGGFLEDEKEEWESDNDWTFLRIYYQHARSKGGLEITGYTNWTRDIPRCEIVRFVPIMVILPVDKEKAYLQ